MKNREYSIYYFAKYNRLYLHYKEKGIDHLRYYVGRTRFREMSTFERSQFYGNTTYIGEL